jgi:hypothetical protein
MSYEIALQRIERWKSRKRWNSWLDLSYCNLTEIPPLPDNVKKLDLYANRLNNLRGIPPSVKKLDCSRNELYNLYDLPLNLKQLKCRHNYVLKNIDIHTDTIRQLDISCCIHVTEICRLPNELRNLRAHECFKLRTIHALPNKLNRISMYLTNIRVVPRLPSTLRMLQLQHCDIRRIINFPESLKEIILHSYYLHSIPKKFPSNLKHLEISGGSRINSTIHLMEFPKTLEYLETFNDEINFPKRFEF